MFSSVVSAAKSSAVIAMAGVGALSTSLVCRELAKEKKVSKDLYAKLLAEQAAVTQVKAELQALRVTQAHTEDVRAVVATSQDDMKGILTTSTLLNAVLGLSTLGLLLNGRTPRVDF